MRWQDIVIGVVQFCYIIALVPTIRGRRDKPELITSVMNVVLVMIVVVCLITLKLWLSALSAFGVGTAWAVLAVQRLNKANN